MIRNDFSQLVREATQIQGGHIDHAYWRDKNGVWNEPAIEHYTPYYSDHDGICTTLTKQRKKWNDRNTSWTDKCCEAWIPMKWDHQQHSDTQNYIRVVQHNSDTEDTSTSTSTLPASW